MRHAGHALDPSEMSTERRTWPWNTHGREAQLPIAGTAGGVTCAFLLSSGFTLDLVPFGTFEGECRDRGCPELERTRPFPGDGGGRWPLSHWPPKCEAAVGPGCGTSMKSCVPVNGPVVVPRVQEPESDHLYCLEEDIIYKVKSLYSGFHNTKSLLSYVLVWLLSPNRRQRKNQTSKLQELALLLPVPLDSRTKKLTKKEILQQVLHYIDYLQRHIDLAKALLKLYTNIREGDLEELIQDPVNCDSRSKHSTPSNSPCSRKTQVQVACKKPQKKKRSRTSEHQTRDQKPRRCLALQKPEKVSPSPDQKRRDEVGTTTPLRCTSSGKQPKAALSSPRGGAKGGKGKATQELVFYDPRLILKKEGSENDPWLPVCTPEGSPSGSPLALGSPKIWNWSATGHPSEILGLSPSVFSSPEKLLPEQMLEDGAEGLTKALFAQVHLGPESPSPVCKSEAPEDKDSLAKVPGDPSGAHSLFQSSVLLDHCYLSLSETSKAPCSPGNETLKTEPPWKQQEADPEDMQPFSEEDGDYTWTPACQASAPPAGGRMSRKGQASKDPTNPKESKTAPTPTPPKRKCVNGFIMFCRMNRKQYIRACPGTASTTATKELAQLWRVMTQTEQKPYCIKARRFSRLHNRNVKHESSSSEDDCDPPKPFYQLLANRATVAQTSGPASKPPRPIESWQPSSLATPPPC
ncbi:meiosis initiator protein [Rhynchocyon petersi]